MLFNQLLLLCRPGFEKECAGEIIELATEHRFAAYIQTKNNTGIVKLINSNVSSEASGEELITKINFRQLIFSRQWFTANKDEISLPESNRVNTILKIVKSFDKDYYDFSLDYADTNEGKTLNKFCKQFQPHLLAALKKERLLSPHSRWRLHLFFTDSQHVTIGISPTDNNSPHLMGIMRLKMPKNAPSRSTLKMEEAIHWFLNTEEKKKLIANGMTVVDLGAAPGGWSWQFVQRSCLVTAIDNGPMNNDLMNTGMVEHLMTDAFTYKPDKKVNWLICDMAERPLHVSRLIARWFTEGYCQHAIFNLKLPMKKRLVNVQDCLNLLQQTLTKSNIAHKIQAKHLYHDREEITVCITTNY